MIFLFFDIEITQIIRYSNFFIPYNELHFSLSVNFSQFFISLFLLPAPLVKF